MEPSIKQTVILHSNSAYDLPYKCRNVVLSECEMILENYLKVTSQLLDKFVAAEFMSAPDKKMIEQDLTNEGKVKRLLLMMDGHGDKAVLILIDYLKSSENDLENQLGNKLQAELDKSE